MATPGPKPGSKRLTTIRKEAVAAEMRERVMRHVDPLFQAQLCKAVGSIRIFRVDKFKDDNGDVARKHVLVTDPDEMKKVLDDFDGQGAGVIGEDYYFVTEVPPDNKAIDSMLDRTFGKAQQSIAVTNEDTDIVAFAKDLIRTLIEEEKMPAEKALKLTAARYQLPESTLISDANY